MAKARISKAKQKELAKEHIKTYFEKATKVFSENKGLANRYVTLARKIAMKVRMPLPVVYKRKFCKHCYKFLMPNKNARIRVRDKKVIISCLECKKFTRIPLNTRKEGKKNQSKKTQKTQSSKKSSKTDSS